MTDRLNVVVYGTPKPAGSKRAFVVNGRAVVSDANANSKPWKIQVAQHVGEIMAERGGLFDGPLRVTFAFYLRRPKGHFKKDGSLSASGRRKPYPDVKPDGLKLARGVEDALSGVAYRDDAQIVDGRQLKLYGEPERVEITVEPALVSAEEVA